MAMIRSSKSETQHPDETEADEEQPERHSPIDGIICGIIDPKTDGQRNQHDRKIDHHQANDKKITPCGHNLTPPALAPLIFTNGKWRVRKRHRLKLRAVVLRLMPLLLLILTTRVRRNDMDFLGSHYLIRTLLRAAETTLHDFSFHHPHPTLENRGVFSLRRKHTISPVPPTRFCG